MNRWTREQTIIALDAYCRIPFNRVSSVHPIVLKTAKLIARSPNSVKMKIGNFGSFDPELSRKGIIGLSNSSKLDKSIWEEFSNNWESLVEEVDRLMKAKNINEPSFDAQIRKAEDSETIALGKRRRYQSFFRSAILASYNSKCAITEIDISEVLIASHIKPWSVDKENRLNPQNGICLNALHDKLFDRGLLTITPDYRVKISSPLLEKDHVYFSSYHDRKLILPNRFLPHPEFLEYHNQNIFVEEL